MNFGQAYLILFALAKFAAAQVGDQLTPKPRGLGTSRDKRKWYDNGYKERLEE
jgi:hypothetical protein